MNKRFLSVLGFALVVSAAASFIVYRLVAARLVAGANRPAIQVVVASRNLAVGTLIRDTDLSQANWNGTVPVGAHTKREELIGRGVLSPIYAGEPVVDTRIAAKGGGAGLAAIIKPGMRAVALKVNEIVGVAGFVTPGMHVDVLIAGNPPNSRNSDLGTQTRTILQNLEVLSAGQNIQKDAEGKPISVQVVNLLVTPEQAEVLSLAGNETKVQLVLRNPLDTEESKPPGTALAQLFGAPRVQPAAARAIPRKPRPKASVSPAAPAPVVAPPQKITIPITVEVLHGSKSGTKKVELSFKQEDSHTEAGEAVAK